MELLAIKLVDAESPYSSTVKQVAIRIGWFVNALLRQKHPQQQDRKSCSADSLMVKQQRGTP